MFHALLNQKIEVFSVYVFSGVIFWSWFSDSFLLGATSLLASQGFIRQKRLPLIGFAVRTSVVSLVTYLLSFVGLLIWFLAMGHRPGWMVLMLPVNVALLAFALFPVTVVSGLLGVLYRDFAQAVQIILQALWFVSPVFLDKTVFARPQLRIWNDWNPISSMLSLVRLPLMDDKIPDIGTYMMVLAFAVVFYVWGFHLLRRHEDRIVYYL